MSKKNLLNETQVRHFMKLARLEPLAPGFINGLATESHGRGKQEGAAGYGHPDANSRLEEEEAGPEELGKFAMDDEADDTLGGDEEAAHDELEAAEEEGEGVDLGGEERTVSVDDFLSALESALEDVMGDEVEIDTDDMGDEEEVEAEMELGPEGGEELEVGVEDETELEERQKYGGNEGDIPDADRKKKTKSGKPGPASREDVEERGEKLNKESTKATAELVEHITKRVAARILKSALNKN